MFHRWESIRNGDSCRFVLTIDTCCSDPSQNRWARSTYSRQRDLYNQVCDNARAWLGRSLGERTQGMKRQNLHHDIRIDLLFPGERKLMTHYLERNANLSPAQLVERNDGKGKTSKYELRALHFTHSKSVSDEQAQLNRDGFSGLIII